MSTPIARTTAQQPSTIASQKKPEAQRIDGALPALETESTRSTEVSIEELNDRIKQINSTIKTYGVVFEISDSNQEVITRVVDSESGEILRQFPSETVLHIAEQLEDLAGLLVRDTV